MKVLDKKALCKMAAGTNKYFMFYLDKNGNFQTQKGELDPVDMDFIKRKAAEKLKLNTRLEERSINGVF